jgi:hypothetical protein
MAFDRSGLPVLVNAEPDGSDDLVGINGSGEGLGLVLCFDDEAIYSGLQVDNRDEDSAPQSPFGGATIANVRACQMMFGRCERTLNI